MANPPTHKAISRPGRLRHAQQIRDGGVAVGGGEVRGGSAESLRARVRREAGSGRRGRGEGSVTGAAARARGDGCWPEQCAVRGVERSAGAPGVRPDRPRPGGRPGISDPRRGVKAGGAA
jgi:hypothetical protein